MSPALSDAFDLPATDGRLVPPSDENWKLLCYNELQGAKPDAPDRGHGHDRTRGPGIGHDPGNDGSDHCGVERDRQGRSRTVYRTPPGRAGVEGDRQLHRLVSQRPFGGCRSVTPLRDQVSSHSPAASGSARRCRERAAGPFRARQDRPQVESHRPGPARSVIAPARCCPRSARPSRSVSVVPMRANCSWPKLGSPCVEAGMKSTLSFGPATRPSRLTNS